MDSAHLRLVFPYLPFVALLLPQPIYPLLFTLYNSSTPPDNNLIFYHDLHYPYLHLLNLILNLPSFYWSESSLTTISINLLPLSWCCQIIYRLWLFPYSPYLTSPTQPWISHLLLTLIFHQHNQLARLYFTGSHLPVEAENSTLCTFSLFIIPKRTV